MKRQQRGANAITDESEQMRITHGDGGMGLHESSLDRLTILYGPLLIPAYVSPTHHLGINGVSPRYLVKSVAVNAPARVRPRGFMTLPSPK